MKAYLVITGKEK